MEASGQFIAAAKHLLGMRGVPVGPGMRAPLRTLSAGEVTELEAAAAAFLQPVTA
jgi:dihydrodipicolinate synthase/N-acetylneuraminate lyase